MAGCCEKNIGEGGQDSPYAGISPRFQYGDNEKQIRRNVEIKNRQISVKEKEIADLLEDQSYYKIRAVRDGVIITNSDTVDAGNSAGTSVAVVYSVKKTLFYSYFEEKDA